MTFTQTEAILLVAYIVLWWLFYFAVKMRADQKYLKSDLSEDQRPCLGCMVTQSAMMAAATLAIIYGAILMDWIGFKQ
jgi:heme/copper-type cytochrome/quinol oxidase subunit 2